MAKREAFLGSYDGKRDSKTWQTMATMANHAAERPPCSSAAESPKRVLENAKLPRLDVAIICPSESPNFALNSGSMSDETPDPPLAL